MITTLAAFVLTAQLGINIMSPSDYTQPMFYDAAKQARCFGSPAASFDCKFADKIPPNNEPFGMFVYTDIPNTEGTYKISYKGKSDLGSSGKVQNLVYDGTKTTAEVVMGSQPMSLSFTNIVSPIGDISIIRPGSDLGWMDSALVLLGLKKVPSFMPDFIESLKPYSAIRMMGWVHANKHPVKLWTDRKLPTDVIQTGPRGVAWEYIIAVANEANKDLYINTPWQFDEDYTRQLAKLLKDTLNSNLKIFVEYSNELWNTAQGFHGNDFKSLAVAEVAAGAKDLTMDNPADTNQWYWARRLVAKNTIKISKIFREVFGDAAMGSKVQIVLAGHAPDHSKLRAALQYADKYEGKDNVKKHIQHIAIAPYFATKSHLIVDAANKVTGVKPDATIETVLTGCQGSINSNKANWVSRKPWDGKSQDVNHKEYADYYGLKLMFYESGQHMNETIGAALVKQTKLDPRFKDVYKNYFMEFFTKNLGAYAFQFIDVSTWKTGNEFGAAPDYKTETPQTLALKEVAALVNGTIPPPVTCDDEKAEIVALKAQVSSLEAGLKEKEDALKQSQSETFTCNAAKDAITIKVENAKKALE